MTKVIVKRLRSPQAYPQGGRAAPCALVIFVPGAAEIIPYQGGSRGCASQVAAAGPSEHQSVKGNQKTMKCIECPKPIHPERLAVNPRVKTCSTACSANRKRRHRGEAGDPLPPAPARQCERSGGDIWYDDIEMRLQDAVGTIVVVLAPCWDVHRAFGTAWRLVRRDHPY